MNGGDLHYHLSQHGVFSETEVRFYCAEIILGLEHMHSRFVVYRDLKVTNNLPIDVDFTSVKSFVRAISRINFTIYCDFNVWSDSVL